MYNRQNYYKNIMMPKWLKEEYWERGHDLARKKNIIGQVIQFSFSWIFNQTKADLILKKGKIKANQNKKIKNIV